jgi:hypothetical protein
MNFKIHFHNFYNIIRNVKSISIEYQIPLIIE